MREEQQFQIVALRTQPQHIVVGRGKVERAESVVNALAVWWLDDVVDDRCVESPGEKPIVPPVLVTLRFTVGMI